jgi:hypothetical protein
LSIMPFLGKKYWDLFQHHLVNYVNDHVDRGWSIISWGSFQHHFVKYSIHVVRSSHHHTIILTINWWHLASTSNKKLPHGGRWWMHASTCVIRELFKWCQVAHNGCTLLPNLTCSHFSHVDKLTNWKAIK